jgi:phosphodiester glycosidase
VRKLLLFPACVLALIASPAWAGPSPKAFHVPPGFHLTAAQEIAPGLTHATLVRRVPATVVNVAARSPGSQAEFRVLLSNGAVGGPEPQLERTSSMCARVDCLVAVNGDFFGAVAGEPVGAIVAGDQLLRSPNPRHHQLTEAADGTFSTGQLTWRGTLVPSDLRQISLDGVNVPREANGLVLYTPAEGPTTGQNRYGAELTLQVVRPAGSILLGKTTLMRVVGLRHDGDTPIPADGVVLSGHGRGQRLLDSLWERVQMGDADPEMLLRLEVTPGAQESVGGSPILVRDGKRWFADEQRDLYQLRAPRTLAGWTPDGTLLLVTVDGRQSGYSVGMTMDEAADLMIGLGAVEAINLDGGGSTAFVVDGSVVNRPSDRAVRRDGKTVVVKSPRPGERVIGNVERPVAVAVALIGPRSTTPIGGGALPSTLVSPLNGGDVTGSGPALVLVASSGLDASAIAMVLTALCLAVVSARRRRAIVSASPAR